MTNKDTAGVLAFIERLYPNHRKSEQDRLEMVRVWASMFPEDNAQDVMQAVRMFAASDTSGFPPTVGQIRAKLVQMHAPQIMGAMEAWGLVSKACRNGYYGCQQEFDKLPPMIQRVVGSPQQIHDWSMLDEDTLESVIGSNFQRAYRVMESREAELAALPEAQRRLLTDGY